MPYRPIMLAVVGDSAAGKTTLTSGIAAILGPDSVTAIGIDDYHRYNRAQRRSLGVTALHPDCNYVDIIEQHLRCLAAGEPILKPVYNHRSGDFEPPQYVRPRPFVIVEGLLCTLTPKLRDCFHVKVFLDPAEELRRAWKVRRDCAERGYTNGEVLAELAKRAADAAMYIHPQRSWADIVVQFAAPSQPAASSHLDARLTLRPTLPHPDLSEVVAQTGNEPQALRLSVGREEGRLAEFLDIQGGIAPALAADVQDVIWRNLPDVSRLRPDQIGTFQDGYEQRQSHPLGLTQLLIAHHLLLARREKEALARMTGRA
ncbi:MAG: phosphoribulokinase [Roseiflexaceae bacterium]|nr:phosphoribulokinase [Roseiflexaceae bacterium]